MTYYVHDSAVVDDGALIGEGARIWHFVHVCRGAKIGCHTSLGQGVYVAKTAVIGNNCKIQNNVSIYDEVVIDDDVFCGPSMVFTNVYNPRAFIERKDEFRVTRVRRGATLGANCTVVCGLEIGRYAFVGAGAVVKRDIKPFELVVGVPAKQIGWMSKFGERIPLPVSGKGEWICRHTGDVYELSAEGITLHSAGS